MYPIVLIFLSIALIPTRGFFSLVGIYLILFSVLLLVLLIFKPKFILFNNLERYQKPMLTALLLISVSGWGGQFQDRLTIVVSMFLLVGIVFGLWCFKKLNVIILYVLYLLLALLVVLGSPHPYVDTVVILKEAPMLFVHGVNPYAATFSQVYPNVVSNYYNYLPFSFIYLVPFVVIFGDHRFAVIISHLFAAILLYRLLLNRLSSELIVWIVAVFLFLPGIAYMLEFGYLDSIIVMFFLAYEYLSLMPIHKNLSLFFLGLFFSVKQPPLLSFPLILRQKRLEQLNGRDIATIFFFPVILVLSFTIWNSKAFIEDTVTGLTPSAITSPINLSMTIPTLLVFNGIMSRSVAVQVCLFLLTICYVLLILCRFDYSKKLILFLLAFNLLSYHAFFNSYFIIMMLLVYEYAKSMIDQSDFSSIK